MISLRAIRTRAFARGFRSDLPRMLRCLDEEFWACLDPQSRRSASYGRIPKHAMLMKEMSGDSKSMGS
jgi:hypothetical protein